ncbi:unnamed protein product [Effrenium voratum]|uniref:Uncharacterized protein n=1 Tax=Effrenium voratum TaxID=2562239 RepID=A0AA36NI16_9DINO|nr:unnamed protein product [Effrenium voratum]
MTTQLKLTTTPFALAALQLKSRHQAPCNTTLSLAVPLPWSASSVMEPRRRRPVSCSIKALPASTGE